MYLVYRSILHGVAEGTVAHSIIVCDIDTVASPIHSIFR